MNFYLLAYPPRMFPVSQGRGPNSDAGSLFGIPEGCMNWRNLFRFLTFALAFGMFASLAAAQLNPTGTLNGTVLDPSGAVIAGASIEVKDSETGAAIQAKSDVAGRFTLANLQPGDFTVTVTASNFQTGVFKNVKVVVGQIYDLK